MASIRGFQDYECVRRYLEHIYLYGFFSREDFNSITGGSSKDYDRVLPLLRDLVPVENQRDVHGRDLKRIRRQYATSGQNPMANSYMLHAIRMKTHLFQYLQVLTALRYRDQSLDNINRRIWNLPTQSRSAKDAANPTDEDLKATYVNTRHRLDEMASYGYIKKMAPGQYTMDGIKLSDQQVQQLYDYVCFAAEITYPRVPGSFLRRTLERELYRRGLEPRSDSPFVLRHNTSHNVFDEEVVFQLLDAMENRYWVLIDDRRYLPVQLRPECRLGRWYVVLVEWYQDQLSPSIRPLSRVSRVQLLEKDEQVWQQARQVAEETYRYSLYSGTKAEAPTLVEVELLFGELRGLEQQFIRELRAGEVNRDDAGVYYRVQINDPLELLPLLRAYSPWLRILPGNHDLDDRLRASLSNMKAALTDQVWVQPKLKRRGEPPEKKAGGKRSQLKLLNRFQSRQMQCSLELMARLEGRGTLSADQVRRIAEKYGIWDWRELLDGLVSSRFLQRLGDLYALDRQPAPVLPLGQVEREYLQYILTLPEATLFLPEQTNAALITQPPGWMDYICRFEPKGMSLPKNPGPDGFRILLEAIKTRRMIHYQYRTKGSRLWKEAQCLPWKLEYSAYDRRWWIILYDPADQRTIKAPLNHLYGVRLGKKGDVTEAQLLETMDRLRMDEPVTLRLTDRHNALQRCFLAFENQEIRSSCRIVEGGQVHYLLTFDAYRFDEEEILRRLMHLGDNVALLSPGTLRLKLIDQVEDAARRNGS